MVGKGGLNDGRTHDGRAGGLSRMNTSCSSSSAVHNTQADFSRWRLWEKNDKSVGRGVYGSCAFFAELWAYFCLLTRGLGEKFLLKSQAQGFQGKSTTTRGRRENT